MKKLSALFVFFGMLLNAQTSSIDVYPIYEDGLWGYINSKGEKIIEPRFYSASEFSEGLASVRSNGTYGYINLKGEFVIPERFDIAYHFFDGQAPVFINGKPYFINKNGDINFEHEFVEIFHFGSSQFTVAKTKDDVYYIIDRLGKPIIDRGFQRVDRARKHGLFVVTGDQHNPYPEDETVAPVFQKGVIDSTGHMIVDYGKYAEINQYINDYAEVELVDDPDDSDSVEKKYIDPNGVLKEITFKDKWSYDYDQEYYSEGLMPIRIYTVDPDTIKVWSSRNRYDYKGVINLNGDLVFSHKDWDEITPFSQGRAFVKDLNDHWFLIDTKGNQLHSAPFDDLVEVRSNSRYSTNYFIDNIAFVIINDNIHGIDKNGKTVQTLDNLGFEYDDVYRNNSLLIFRSYDGESEISPYKHGYWNYKQDKLIEPTYNHLRFQDSLEGLCYVYSDNKQGYIDINGNYVWQSDIKEAVNTHTNIDYMKRGYFYATSPESKDDLGGFGSSLNTFRKVKDKFNTVGNQFDIVIQSKTNTKSKLFVVNKSSDSIYLEAQDSRLYMLLQAKDKTGEWRDIEYLPSSWCGNSYHKLFLPPNYYWEFEIPNYVGAYETVVRAKLEYLKNGKSATLFSSEFKASINPGQFWNKLPYSPTGLMDPYND